MKVGFIGLGNMGSGMAANLLTAGHEVVVHNRTPAKAQPLIDQGARLAQKIADACHGDAVFTMLADDTTFTTMTLEQLLATGALPRPTIAALRDRYVLDSGR